MAVTSYNGWAASPNPSAIGINAAWAPLGQRFPGGVKSGDVETVFTYLVHQLHARVEPIDRDAIKDEWGYYYKQSANSPSLLSCHSSGTAIDYNATRHPNRVRGTWTPTQMAEIRRILAELGGVVRWLALTADGGSARSTPDEMHFEIHGSPGQVAAVASRLRSQQGDELTMAQIDDIMAKLDVIHSEQTKQHSRVIELLEGLPARFRSTVYTARDGLAKLIRDLHG
jgi:hypothetical protein